MRFKSLDWLENCKSYILVNLLTTLGALPFAILPLLLIKNMEP